MTTACAALILGCVLTGAVAGCDGGEARKRAEACAAAWEAGLATMGDQAATLDAAEPALAQRLRDAKKEAAAAEKRLAALTIRRQDAQRAYPDRLKARVASARMRMATVQPVREEPEKPLGTIRFSAEIQGDHRRVSKTIEALYRQPKAFFLDRVEVNILDERTRRTQLRIEFHVHHITDGMEEVPEDSGRSPSFEAALAWAAPAGCQAGEDAAARLESARAALAEREALASRVHRVERVEATVKARGELADDLVRRRDDDRAMWAAYADQLVENAKSSVTGIAELRFDDEGDPDWKM